MKTNIMSSLFGVMSASLLALAGGCASEIPVPGENIPDDPYAVRFEMGGSALSGVSTRANETDATVNEHHSEAESKIYNLLAVVFRDEDQNTYLRQQNAVANNDLCVRVIELIKDGSAADAMKPTTDKEEYFFYLKEMGAYHICFVANADESLTTQIKALANAGTYSTFRSLKVEKEPGEKDANKGMTMTTGSYGVVIDGTQSSNLQTIQLTRIMSRIDIYNAAPSIVIKSVDFNGRMIKTPLVETYTYDAANLEPQADGKSKNYLLSVGETEGLPGASIIDETKNTYKAAIYSYSHYGKDADNTAPSLTLHYIVKSGDAESEEKTADVKFKTKDGSSDLNLVRNNLYRLVVSQKDGKLNFELIVADWNEGEQVDVADGDISIEGDEWNIDAAVSRLWSRYIGDGTTETSEDGTSLARYAVNTALDYKPSASAVVADYYCNNGQILLSNSLDDAQTAIDNAKAGIDAEILAMTTLHEIPKTKIQEKINESIDSLRNQLKESKESIIGVVAYLMATAPEGRKVYTGELKDYKGLVLALNNACNLIKWAPTADAKYSLGTLNSSIAQCWANDLDGYTQTQKAKTQDGVNLATNHPAINAAVNYNVKVPDSTTGWYLPSASEFWDIFGPDGLGKMQRTDYERAKTHNYSDDTAMRNYFYIQQNSIYTNITTPFLKAGGESIYESRFWTTSETVIGRSRVMALLSTGVNYDRGFPWSNPAYSNTIRVRPILAFK